MGVRRMGHRSTISPLLCSHNSWSPCTFFCSNQPTHALCLVVVLLLSVVDAGIDHFHHANHSTHSHRNFKTDPLLGLRVYSAGHQNHHRQAKIDDDYYHHYSLAVSSNNNGSGGGGSGVVTMRNNGNIGNYSDFGDSPFENNTSTSTTVPIGDTAFLKCTVKNLGNRTISWIRRRDMHIITVDRTVYTNDERFNILRGDGNDEWILQIKYVQKRDNGTYECQVSAGKGISSFAVNLFVVVPEAFILGNGEYHIRQGSTINLVCIVEKSPKPPEYIFWYHNNRMINYGSNRDLSIQTETGSKTQSRLIINNAQTTDSGNYTCETANADPTSTFVYISQAGDKMAAIQRRKSDGTPGSSSSVIASSSANSSYKLLPVNGFIITLYSFSALAINSAKVGSKS